MSVPLISAREIYRLDALGFDDNLEHIFVIVETSNLHNAARQEETFGGRFFLQKPMVDYHQQDEYD